MYYVEKAPWPKSTVELTVEHLMRPRRLSITPGRRAEAPLEGWIHLHYSGLGSMRCGSRGNGIGSQWPLEHVGNRTCASWRLSCSGGGTRQFMVIPRTYEVAPHWPQLSTSLNTRLHHLLQQLSVPTHRDRFSTQPKQQVRVFRRDAGPQTRLRGREPAPQTTIHAPGRCCICRCCFISRD